MAILDKINTPSDVHKLSPEELVPLAEEIRQCIIDVTSKTGGHIGPNLGVVELTIALHRVFDFPKDQFTFDVSHQAYVHKLLTGRKGEKFKNLRQTGGISGFLCRSESPYDSYGAGHAGTALSAALGMATARDLKGSDEHVICMMGDAALTCGITMEALNNINTSTKRLIVILNDNEWSIAKNVGAIAKYLNELITNPIYNRLHNDLESFLSKIPGGESLLRLGSKAKRETKEFFLPSSLFEKFGLRYIGPIDGHNFQELKQYLEFTKESKEPILLHVLTQKGRGYDVAIKNPEKFHGSGAFDLETGESKAAKPNTPPTYQKVFGTHLLKFAKQDSNIVGITGAMPAGTSLDILRKELPKQYFDVGIAEEHAVLFAAGLATQGIKPVVAIYSTFMQRAYDPIIHDVCLQNLNVMFCMDRAGLSANDGPTHHGLFDLSYLRCIPRAVIMQPKDEDELVDMLHTGLEYLGPIFMRYPRGPAEGVKIKNDPELIEIGKAEVIQEGATVWLWALGPMVEVAKKVAKELEAQNIKAGIVNARFVKPLDEELLLKQAESSELIVTLEDNVKIGGLGSAVIETLQKNKMLVPVETIGWPDQFIEHGSSVDSLREAHGLSDQQIYNQVLTSLRPLKAKAEVKFEV